MESNCKELLLIVCFNMWWTMLIYLSWHGWNCCCNPRAEVALKSMLRQEVNSEEINTTGRNLIFQRKSNHSVLSIMYYDLLHP